MADVFEFNPEQTEFSGGLAKIFRLDAIQKQIHMARVEKDYGKWYEWLLSKYLELEVFIKPKDTDEYDQAIRDMRDDFFKINVLIKTKQKVPYDLFGSFYNVETKLARLEQNNGLGIKKIDSRFG